MEPQTKRKYLKIWGWSSLALILIFPGDVFDATVSIVEFLFDHVVEAADLLFEAVESMLDHLIEGVFETDLHSTQTIVFYILLVGILLGFYKIGKFFLYIYRRYQAACLSLIAECRQTFHKCWYDTTAVDKIKWSVISVVAIYCYVAFFI